MEIGSFLELELADTGEYFHGETNIARLNTGRSAILHSLRLMQISSIHLPYYLCPSVKGFLIKNGIEVIPYRITDSFEPILKQNEKSTSVLIVNYFGIIPQSIIIDISSRYFNVIIDNCPAFFCSPLPETFNVYSSRKFFGVSDGSYIVGPSASIGTMDYNQDSSSDTSAFLLKRIEKGSSAVYAERMENENRLDQSDVLQMSGLTRRILQSINYDLIKVKRLENFNYASRLFKKYNQFNPENLMDSNCVPMVYPLVIEDDNLMNKLKNRGIYTGRWWNSVLNDVPESSFEAYMSRFMIPIPIDQRYGKTELDFISKVFQSS